MMISANIQLIYVLYSSTAVNLHYLLAEDGLIFSLAHDVDADVSVVIANAPIDLFFSPVHGQKPIGIRAFLLFCFAFTLMLFPICSFRCELYAKIKVSEILFFRFVHIRAKYHQSSNTVNILIGGVDFLYSLFYAN